MSIISEVLKELNEGGGVAYQAYNDPTKQDVVATAAKYVADADADAVEQNNDVIDLLDTIDGEKKDSLGTTYYLNEE